MLRLSSVFFLLTYLNPFNVSSQLINDGAMLFIESGATLTVKGNASNLNSGILDLYGTLDISGNLTNSATLTTQSNSLVKFSDSGQSQFLSGGAQIYHLEINKDNSSVQLSDDLAISDMLTFNSGHVQLGNHNLIMQTSASIINANASRFVVTNGEGYLEKMSLSATPFLFPAGNSTANYNPLILTNSGTTDHFGVRVLDGVYEDGEEATLPITGGVVNASWEVIENTLGGSVDLLTVTPQWAQDDELPGFNRNEAVVSWYNGSNWELNPNEVGSASGGNPYTFTRNNGSPGVYGVSSAFANPESCACPPGSSAMIMYISNSPSADTVISDFQIVSDLTIEYGISPDTTVFQAGCNIILTPGFHAQAGVYFHAYLDCSEEQNLIEWIPPILVSEENSTLDENSGGLDFSILPNVSSTGAIIYITSHEEQRLQLLLYDQNGRLVKTIIPGDNFIPGTYTFNLQLDTYVSGMYYVQLISPMDIQTRRMVVVKN